MSSIPQAAEPLIHECADAFTRPTYRRSTSRLCRFVVLLSAAIMTTGRHTVTNLLRTVSVLAPGHPSSYHRGANREDGAARRPVSVRVVLGDRVALRLLAGQPGRCRWGRVARQDRPNVLRCHHRSTTMALGHSGFCNTHPWRCLCKTIPACTTSCMKRFRSRKRRCRVL